MSRYIVIGLHDATSEPRHVLCRDTYEDALKGAGVYWKAQDLAFDLKREDPFYVEPDTYDEKVFIFRKDGEIRSVQHSNGDGCCIWILPETV